MLIRGKRNGARKTFVANAAFTLIEVLISLFLFAMVMSGVIYGYVQTNNFAEWTSMSLAAQSYALQGLESVRGAQWDLSQNPPLDEMAVTTPVTNFIQHDVMDVPVSGAPLAVTNYITLSNVVLVANSAQVRFIQSSCVWVFPLTGKSYTNTVTTFRAPDNQ